MATGSRISRPIEFHEGQLGQCVRRMAHLDEVNLQEELPSRVPMLESCPRFLRGRLREPFAVALRERHCANSVGDVFQTRAWKLFCLVPKMLTTQHGQPWKGRVGSVHCQVRKRPVGTVDANECSSLPSSPPVPFHQAHQRKKRSRGVPRQSAEGSFDRSRSSAAEFQEALQSCVKPTAVQPARISPAAVASPRDSSRER